MKLYPAMDLLQGQVVRLHQGDYNKVTEYPHEPLTLVDRFVRAGAERVHIVDLDGARDGVASQAPLIERLLRETGTRVQVGGGIRSLEQARAYIRAGADRVVLGTAAVRDKAFLRAACAEMPVVVAVDARDGMVTTHGWTEATNVTAIELATEAMGLGAVGVLYTDVARDGTGVGPNIQATAALARAVPSLEVIASGGIGSLAHIEHLAREGVIGACVAGRALLEGAFTCHDAFALLRALG
jgi:phosphoribosylformimino-5-aminoimidazole carboxamide ribotide isomerase